MDKCTYPLTELTSKNKFLNCSVNNVFFLQQNLNAEKGYYINSLLRVC